jgi:hypothetical protein
MANNLPSTEDDRLIVEGFGSRAFSSRTGPNQGNQLPAVRADHSPGAQRFGVPFDRQTVDEIAELLRSLTYGDMIADGGWDARSLGLDLSKDTLPGVLHRWGNVTQAVIVES